MNYSLMFKAISFNVAELLCIYGAGHMLQIDMLVMTIVILSFAITRCCFGGAMHYKQWYQCFVATLFLFLSLSLLFHLDLLLCLLMTIFSGTVLTSKGDIKDVFLWKGAKTKNQDVADYIKTNSDNPKLAEFEDDIKNNEKLLFEIYEYRFKEGYSFSKISKLTNIDTQRISEHLDTIAFHLRRLLKI